MNNRLKVGVLISGNGTNLQSLIDAAKQVNFPAEIALVISNNPNAFGLSRASKANIPIQVIDHNTFEDREAFDRAIDTALKKVGCKMICLAGFMRVLSAQFVDSWPMKIINIHPSLLPSFKGINAQKQAIEAGVQISGCSIHFVTSQLDSGPIIAQVAIPVLNGDTPTSLSARILEHENKVYPIALETVANKFLCLNPSSKSINQSETTDSLLSIY
ncbi:MAG: phosphoribosylglycinamide formyltransferase [Alphaproteobacteria bacterium]|nr:phosphoribosylglycinamide formyltransferase [Alphaproteobacteria bacterium]MDG1888179.1 phosphoribosylglycinamide formyltransferase [Alphaproteobacteria bacterium]